MPVYSVPTPYALDVLGSPMWQVATETKRQGSVAINKNLWIQFDDQTGQTTYEFNLSRKEWLMRVNGGSWTKVDTSQDRVYFLYSVLKLGEKVGLGASDMAGYSL